MKKRILRKLSEEKLLHLLLGDLEKFPSLWGNTLWEQATFSGEIKLKNSVAFVSLQYLFDSLHSFVSIRGLI